MTTILEGLGVVSDSCAATMHGDSHVSLVNYQSGTDGDSHRQMAVLGVSEETDSSEADGEDRLCTGAKTAMNATCIQAYLRDVQTKVSCLPKL